MEMVPMCNGRQTQAERRRENASIHFPPNMILIVQECPKQKEPRARENPIKSAPHVSCLYNGPNLFKFFILQKG